MDLTVVAYATLALSLFVSAVKVGGFILNADPPAIITSASHRAMILKASPTECALDVQAVHVASLGPLAP